MSTHIVKLWDGFDGEWMTVFGPDTQEACQAYWNDRTDNGTKKVRYGDIDYYKIFPAGTRHRFQDGNSQTRPNNKE